MAVNNPPMYVVIEEELRRMITQRSPGDPLPSDTELCDQFGVSRMTARHAKQRLAAEGLIYREPGVGTFVARPPIHRPVSQLMSFSQEMRGRGLEPTSRLLIAEMRQPAEEEADGLGIDTEEAVVHIRRLRLGDETPIAVQDTLLPDSCAAVLDADLETESLHAILENIGRRPVRARGRLSPEVADAETAELLALAEGSPLLVEHLTVFDEHDVAVELARTRYAGGRYVFDFESGETTLNSSSHLTGGVLVTGAAHREPDEPMDEAIQTVTAPADLAGHVVVCGWSSKGGELVRELLARESDDSCQVVVVAPLAEDPTGGTTSFVSGDPTESAVLERAGVARAHSVVVLADKSDPTRTESDLDARTLLTSLAVEALNQDCSVAVELVRPENRHLFNRVGVEEILVDAETGGRLLAAAIVTHGVSQAIGELVSSATEGSLRAVSIPEDLVGESFDTAINEMRSQDGVLPVAVRREDGRFVMNPPSDSRLRSGDELLVISAGEQGPTEGSGVSI